VPVPVSVGARRAGGGSVSVSGGPSGRMRKVPVGEAEARALHRGKPSPRSEIENDSGPAGPY
jgi:hypothetical protein